MPLMSLMLTLNRHLITGYTATLRKALACRLLQFNQSLILWSKYLPHRCTTVSVSVVCIFHHIQLSLHHQMRDPGGVCRNMVAGSRARCEHHLHIWAKTEILLAIPMGISALFTRKHYMKAIVRKCYLGTVLKLVFIFINIYYRKYQPIWLMFIGKINLSDKHRWQHKVCQA